MEKIFTLDVARFPSSVQALEYILREYYGQKNPQIARTENGKPYLKNGTKPLFFSLSHTQDLLFIALSDENVGIDAECKRRKVRYASLLSKFAPTEREQISSCEDFLRFWTVKESGVKWLGGTLAHDLKKLVYADGKLVYNGLELPVYITERSFGDCLVCVCSERNFSNAEWITV